MALRTAGTCFTTSASTRLAMAACHGSMLAIYACTPASPSDLGRYAGLRAFRDERFAAFGFLADIFVDLEVGIAARTVLNLRLTAKCQPQGYPTRDSSSETSGRASFAPGQRSKRARA